MLFLFRITQWAMIQYTSFAGCCILLTEKTPMNTYYLSNSQLTIVFVNSTDNTVLNVSEVYMDRIGLTAI